MKQLIKPVIRNQLAMPLMRRKISGAGCWFIDIPRTSSVSCRAELADRFGWPYYHKNKFVKKFAVLHMKQHQTALEVRRQLGTELWQSIFTFSIVRNPWDRCLSFFLWDNNPRSFGYRSFPTPSAVKQVFKNYLIQTLPKLSVLGPAEAYLLDEDGNMIVNFVAKYENRRADLTYIGQKINFPEFGQKYSFGKKTSSKYHYSEYYDNELRDWVAEIAKWEIEKFNYSFDLPATQAESRQGGDDLEKR